MRVKEKPYPMNHGVDTTTVVAPSKNQTNKVNCVIVPEASQVLDLSKPIDGENNGFYGVTETDAIHRRLGSTDGGAQNLAKSIVELMENSPTAGGKRKRSPIKTLPPKAREVIGLLQSSTGDSRAENMDTSASYQEPMPEAQVVNSDSKAKKKPAAQPNKKATKKKKNLKKKMIVKDEEDYNIDPRLGGSKIKKSIHGKGKDKKLKPSLDQDLKKNKSSEQRFPCVHIEGAWNVPTIVKIVNGPVREDEAEGKSSTKLTKAAQYIDEEHRNKAAKVGFTSTLSERYDTHNRDTTWVCAFCQHYTHMQCLGDLYGPYYINKVPAEPVWFSKKNPDTRNSLNEIAECGPSSPGHSPKKAKKSPKKKCPVKEEFPSPHHETLPAEHMEAASFITPSTSRSEEKAEVWFHESCLIWAPGVCLVPPRLVGLDEAVADSSQVVCEYCKKRGGHIFCRSRGCGLRTHYPCALSQGWYLKEETFMALCPTHVNQAAIT